MIESIGMPENRNSIGICRMRGRDRSDEDGRKFQAKSAAIDKNRFE